MMYLSIKKFNVIATVNHAATFDKGHYTAYVKQPNSSCWQFCIDAAVLRSSVEKVNKCFILHLHLESHLNKNNIAL